MNRQPLATSIISMRPQKLLFILSMLCMPMFSVAQVGGVLNDADDNSNDHSSGSSSSGGSSWDDDDDKDDDSFGSECLSDACTGCVDAIDWGTMCTGFFAGTGNLFVLNQEKIDNDKGLMPWIAGVELMYHVGYQSSDFTVWQKPEIRVHYAALNMQYRYTHLEDNTGAYSTSDWQFLVFDLVNSQTVTLSLGNGIMHEYYTKRTYYELTGGLELHFEDHKYNPSIEYRHAIDGQTSAIPRQEFCLRFDYKLFTKNIFHFHLSGAYTYQRYYQNTDFNLLSAGVNIGIY
jgi:hypothetical protein